MPDDLLYQIALTLVPNVGAVQAKILVDHYNTAQNVFKTKKRELEKLEGIGAIRAQAIKDFTNFLTAEEEMKFVEQFKIETLFISEPNFPQRLKECYDAPTLLYYRGTANLNHPKIVSIIGTRNNTDYGKHAVEQLVAELQNLNVLVASGLAYGIDILAHKAALHHQLPTVGVLAHGLDKIYPADHKSTAKQMCLNGGLLTEFRKNTLPDKHNFPRRNRIVAGLADCTIVVETAAKGGSMITAELANGYNRDVFAYPGKVTDAKSAGCNYLIKQNKAILLTDAQQLVEKMGWLNTKVKPKPQKELFITFTAHEQLLVNIIKEKDTIHVDELFLKSGLTSSTVAAAMLNLEFENIIVSMPGKMYKMV